MVELPHSGLVRDIVEPNGGLKLEIRQDRDGKLYRYHLLRRFPSEELAIGVFGDSYWSELEMSGVYDQLAECEKAGRLAFDLARRDVAG